MSYSPKERYSGMIKVNGEWERRIPSVELRVCDYDKKLKRLSFASEYVGMPSEFEVVSHHTGKKVKFVTVKYGDPLFCQDGWDGEQQIYRSVETLPNIDYLVIYNQY